MNLEEIKSYIQRIIDLEFTGRDNDIAVNLTRLKAEISSRGMSNSTVALTQVADFFLQEFALRSELLLTQTLARAHLLQQQTGHDPADLGVALYTQFADEQFERLLGAYDDFARVAAAPLKSNMPAQIRELLVSRLDNRRSKNKLVIEFEYKVLPSSPAKELVSMRPGLWGISVDLKELWGRLVK